MYVDSAYISKFYVNEPDSGAVRDMIRRARSLVCSSWCMAEVTCVLHRHLREGWLTPEQARELTRAFLEHIDSGLWTLVPVTERILRRLSQLVSTAPRGIFLRAGDAVHLTTAQDLGEAELWTNDRHLLAAASHFGLVGRSV